MSHWQFVVPALAASEELMPLSGTSSDENESENDDEIDTTFAEAYTKLISLLHSHEVGDGIHIPPAASIADLLIMCLTFSNACSLSNAKTANLFDLVNSIFGEDILPNTRNLLDSFFNPRSIVSYHAVCTDCECYISTYDKNQHYVHCNNCDRNINVKGEAFNSFFVTVNTKYRIGNLISKYARYYDFVTKVRVHERGKFENIYDGRCYREIVDNLKMNGCNDYVTLTFNTDGAPVFESSVNSIWPIQFIINEIPPKEQLKTPVLYGLWFGKSKPDMNVFLHPFVEEMNNLSEEGFQFRINGDLRQIKVFPICCCVDSQARPMLQGLIQYNGHYGCSWCLQDGLYISSAMRYSIGENVPKNRTMLESLEHIDAALNAIDDRDRRQRGFGFVTSPQLLNLTNFDIIEGFVPDYLHCVNLGLAEKFLNYWIEDPATYTNVNNLQVTVDELLKNIKVHIQMERRSRLLKHRSKFKGREYENWALFLSMPILRNILKTQYLHHWGKFVEGIYILLQEEINIEAIDRADRLLYEFIAETEELYGVEAMVYNVHQMKHISTSVLNWGPLWSHSGYVFESGNGQLVKKIHAAKGVCSQVCRSVGFEQSVECIKSIIPLADRRIADHFEDSINFKMISNSIIFENTRYFGKGKTADDDFFQTINVADRNYKLYSRIVRYGCLYSTSFKINRRTNNSFAQLNDGSYIQLRVFLLNSTDRRELTTGNKLVTSNAFQDSCSQLQFVDEISEEISVIDTTEILKPCIFLEIMNNHYICAIPNVMHY